MHNTGYIAGDNGMLLKTTNSGLSWDSLNSYLNYRLSDVEFINELTGFAGGRYGYILKTTNGGIDWDSSRLEPGLFSSNINEFYFLNENTGFAGCNSWDIYKTTNQGQSWILKTNFGSASPIFAFHFFNEDNGIATASNGYLLRTTNGGENWTQGESLSSSDLYDITFVNQSTGYIVSEGFYENPNIFKSTNSGANWQKQNFRLFTGGHLFGIINIDDTTLVSVGTKGTVIKTYSGGEPVNIPLISSEIPTSFSLYQNYPNPFNPITKIRFSIPSQSDLSLAVYDILGRKIETLFSGNQPSGTYEFKWDASRFSSGVYFYRLEAGNFVQTRKMLLIK